MRNNYADRDAASFVISKHDATSNANAACTKAADPYQFWAIDEITWSYTGGTPTGRLTAVLGSTTILDIDITASGPGQVQFHKPRHNAATKNELLTITLYAGGSGVTGKVSARIR